MITMRSSFCSVCNAIANEQPGCIYGGGAGEDIRPLPPPPLGKQSPHLEMHVLSVTTHYSEYFLGTWEREFGNYNTPTVFHVEGAEP